VIAGDHHDSVEPEPERGGESLQEDRQLVELAGPTRPGEISCRQYQVDPGIEGGGEIVGDPPCRAVTGPEGFVGTEHQIRNMKKGQRVRRGQLLDRRSERFRQHREFRIGDRGAVTFLDLGDRHPGE
jgi:hypothetical protein